MTIAKLNTKTIAVAVGLALALSVVFGFSINSVGAQSMSLAQLVDLLVAAGVISPDKAAAAKAVVAGSSSATTYTRDLTVGSTGADVTALQTMLGVSPATGYFGSLTKAAVQQYQASKGIPSTGYVGPLTRASLNSGVVVTTPGSGSTMTGSGEGFLDDVEQISSLSAEEVGEGEEDVKVLGLNVTAEDADQKIDRVIVEIDTPTDADDLEDFITDVSIWLDGELLGRMDVEDASYDRSADEYTFRFTGLSGVVSEGDTVDLVAAVSAVNNIDTGDDGEGWTATFPTNGIRAVSPNGVDDFYGAAEDETFTVESFAEANEVDMTTTLSSDNPDEQVVIVDNEGDEVTLLAFEVEADGSDITINDIPVVLTSANANLNLIIDEATLFADGEEVSNSTSTIAGTSQTHIFDDLDLTVNDGDTVQFTVVVKSATSSISGAQGITLSAAITPDNIDAEDESGEEISDGDSTGSASGETQHLFTIAPEVEVISTSIAPIDNGSAAPESATAKIKVKITARGGTIYLNGDDESTATDELAYVLVDQGNASTTASSTSYTVSGEYTTTNSGVDNEYFTVNEDDSITVEVTGIVSLAIDNNDAAVLAGMKVSAIQFGTVSTDDDTRSAIDLNWSDLTDLLKSGVTPLINPS